MEIYKKVAYILQEIDQLPETAQEELIEAIVAMRCPHLGIDQIQDIDAVSATR